MNEKQKQELDELAIRYSEDLLGCPFCSQKPLLFWFKPYNECAWAITCERCEFETTCDTVLQRLTVWWNTRPVVTKNELKLVK